MKNLGRFRLDTEVRRPVVAFRAAELAFRALRDYHRHEVIGLGHFPTRGPVLLLTNHSFATYDAWLLAIPLHDELGRIPYAIGDRLMLRAPFAGSVLQGLGFIEGSRESVVEFLQRDEILGISVGGMREALRSSRDKYRIDWSGRLGFAWASMLSGAPIVLAACPRADDIYDVADLAITRRVYERFKVPLALARGLGPTLVPRPIKLWHLLSEPIVPPVAPDRVTKEDVVAHHAFVCQRMTRLMEESLDLDLP
jgi:1-acyl-sn-glycerol-3-phosphate acyltransferase